MQPFDLAKALKGGKLVRRNGAKIIQFINLLIEDHFHYIAVDENHVLTWHNSDGNVGMVGGNNLDLLMAGIVRYANVYELKNGTIFVTSAKYETMADAASGHCRFKSKSSNYKNYIKTIKVEFEI